MSGGVQVAGLACGHEATSDHDEYLFSPSQLAGNPLLAAQRVCRRTSTRKLLLLEF